MAIVSAGGLGTSKSTPLITNKGAFVKVLGVVYTSGSSGTSVITTTAEGGAGNTIIIVGKGSVGFKITDASDTRSNTYTQDAFNEATANTLTVLSAPITTTLQTGDTITVNYEGSAVSHTVYALEYSGILLSSPVDDFSTAGVSSTTVSSGVVDTTLAKDILISACAVNSNVDAFTVYPTNHTIRVNFNAGGVWLGIGDYSPGATGSYNSTWTIGATTRNLAAILVAYKPLV